MRARPVERIPLGVDDGIVLWNRGSHQPEQRIPRPLIVSGRR
jgi:hypothetical protein